MLFHSTIRKELARTFGATLVVLITIVMTIMLIRTLGLATRGIFNPQDVMMVLGYTVLGYLPTILTLSLFIATTVICSPTTSTTPIMSGALSMRLRTIASLARSSSSDRR